MFDQSQHDFISLFLDNKNCLITSKLSTNQVQFQEKYNVLF